MSGAVLFISHITIFFSTLCVPLLLRLVCLGLILLLVRLLGLEQEGAEP